MQWGFPVSPSLKLDSSVENVLKSYFPNIWIAICWWAEELTHMIDTVSATRHRDLNSPESTSCDISSGDGRQADFWASLAASLARLMNYMFSGRSFLKKMDAESNRGKTLDVDIGPPGSCTCAHTHTNEYNTCTLTGSQGGLLRSTLGMNTCEKVKEVTIDTWWCSTGIHTQTVSQLTL